MPQDEHPAFQPPDDVHVAVWRYMDFTKFVSMLEHEGLYFPRSDRLDDKFEGSYPGRNLESHRSWIEALKTISAAPENLDFDRIREGNRDLRRRVFLNCWHMNDHESAAMWDLYAHSNEAVAIRSTYSRLRDEIEDNSDPDSLVKNNGVGCVKYIDFANEQIPRGDQMQPFMHKRKSFAHEQEVRAVKISWHDAVDGDPDREVPGLEFGVWQHVNLDRLVDRIFVAPTAPGWLAELVESVVSRYGLDKPVQRSKLDDEPIW